MGLGSGQDFPSLTLFPSAPLSPLAFGSPRVELQGTGRQTGLSPYGNHTHCSSKTVLKLYFWPPLRNPRGVAHRRGWSRCSVDRSAWPARRGANPHGRPHRDRMGAGGPDPRREEVGGVGSTVLHGRTRQEQGRAGDREAGPWPVGWLLSPQLRLLLELR